MALTIKFDIVKIRTPEKNSLELLRIFSPLPPLPERSAPSKVSFTVQSPCLSIHFLQMECVIPFAKMKREKVNLEQSILHFSRYVPFPLTDIEQVACQIINSLNTDPIGIIDTSTAL